MPSFDASNHLPQLLKERGWTQQQLADAAGIARTDINRFCTGKQRLGLARARRIADALGVSLLELGAPDPLATDAASNDLRDRLAALGAQGERQAKTIRDLTRRLSKAEALLAELLPHPDTRRRERGGR